MASTVVSLRTRPKPRGAFTHGLPKTAVSLCPECRQRIQARLFAADDKVWMEKSCPAHGHFLDLYWSDVYLYEKAERWFFSEGAGFENPLTENPGCCPEYCGLCQRHRSWTCVGNIDLTNRCNLTCPVCFANASVTGYRSEPSFEEVVAMLRRLRDLRPVPCTAIQFTGGEPTLHPRFFDILAAARELGFSHIQIASNGLKLVSKEFTQRCAAAGLHTVYLQFDGVSDASYEQTRGRRLWREKCQAIENVHRAGMKVVLVPTIVRGVNDDQVGPILEFAVANRHVISGISYQPVCFTGRIDHGERLRQRFTLPDMAHAIEAQTGILEAHRDWYPLACISPFPQFLGALRGAPMPPVTCHPHCALGTFVYVDRAGRTYPITRFLDVERALTRLDQINRGLGRRFSKVGVFLLHETLKRCFRPEAAPPGLSLEDFIESLMGLVEKDIGRSRKWQELGIEYLFVAGMHFMDLYNYEAERVERCVIHYAAADGRLYPFCTYNSGPTYRERVERAYSVPLARADVE